MHFSKHPNGPNLILVIVDMEEVCVLQVRMSNCSVLLAKQNIIETLALFFWSISYLVNRWMSFCLFCQECSMQMHLLIILLEAHRQYMQAMWISKHFHTLKGVLLFSLLSEKPTSWPGHHLSPLRVGNDWSSVFDDCLCVCRLSLVQPPHPHPPNPFSPPPTCGRPFFAQTTLHWSLSC